MNDLLKQSKIDFKNKSARDVGKRLPLMKTEGEVANKSGNYKTAFIFLKRWLNTVEWIKTTKSYKGERHYYVKEFSIDKEDEVKKLLAEVEKKLFLIFSPDKVDSEFEDASMMEDRVEAKKSSIEGVLNLPETPTDEPLAKESEDFTTCRQLFQFMKPNFRPLIIDVRPREDFQESRIKTNRCINIPADAIVKGVLAQKYEKLFANDPESLYLYERRGSNMTDIIVLLDWSTKSSTLFPDNKMCSLRDILKNWDPGTRVPKVTILDGGFSDWLNSYPSFVTNPKVKTPEIRTSAMDEILEEVKYADWIDTDDDNSPFNELRIKPLDKSKITTKHNIVYRNRDVSPIVRTKINEISSTITKRSLLNSNESSDLTISFTSNDDDEDNSKDPYKFLNEKISTMSRYNSGKLKARQTEDMNIDEDDIIFETTKPNVSTLHKIMAKPSFDRSSKPSSSMKNSSSGGKQLLKLKAQLNELLKNLEYYENEIFSIEMEFYERDKNEDSDTSDESDRADLKDRSKKLHISVDKLITQKDLVKEALSKQSMKSILLNPIDENKKDQLDLSIGGFEQRLRVIARKREALKEKILNKKLAKKNTLMPKLNENGITKEPLKSDGSSANTGLKRSHSSPNLAQLDNGKIPLVDRSSKPRVPITQNPNRLSIGANSKLTWKDREQRMEPIFRDTRPGITGLKNLGNSCYMNSIIQCLSNNIRLAKYFNEDAYLDDLNKSLSICKQGQVADEVAHVIKALWRGQYKSISPRDLKVVIGQYRLQFDSTDQQDSHEFLVFLLDWLHNDLKKEFGYNSDGISIARKQWFKSISNGESIISELFMGQLKSSIICSTCNNSSITYETFNSLTLSLPNTNRCTLDDCVKKFVTGQKVSGWTCDNCKVPREATKKFDFIKLPPTVVIHLNRFAESEGWLQKSNTSVDFPLADLNLGTYLVDDENLENTQIQYDFNKMSLYAVSVHYGTMSGGHYTAYCRNVGQHKWYKYDDQLVSEVSPSEVKNQGTSAYLLFYTTIGNESYPYIQRSPLMKLARF